MTPLGRFINDEIERRKTSIRQFAKLLGITHPILSKIINTENPSDISLGFIARLSSVTGTTPYDIIQMVDNFPVSQLSAIDNALAIRLSKATETEKQLIETILSGSAIQSPKKD